MAKKTKYTEKQHPLGHSADHGCPTVLPHEEKQIKYHGVCERIADGQHWRDACHSEGVTFHMFENARRKYPSLKVLYEESIAMMGRDVIHSLIDTATGKAIETRITTDSDGVSSTVVTQLAPNIQAQKYLLNNVLPKEWADKGEHSTGSKVIINMPAVTIGGKPMRFDCGVVDAEVVNE
jgi:hypothetical protein